MSTGLLFWILMILWLLFGCWTNWPQNGSSNGFQHLGGSLLEFVLLFLLGWKVFGFPIQN